MAFDFSTLFWIFLAIMVLQPLFTGRWYALRRAQAIRAAAENIPGVKAVEDHLVWIDPVSGMAMHTF